MSNFPFDTEIVAAHVKALGLNNLGGASIREIRKLVSNIENETGERFVRMEMGIPGLSPSSIGIQAEISALKNGCAAVYPDVEGIPEVKREISRFVKSFINLDVAASSCLPVTGSMNGCYIAMLVTGKMYRKKDTVLFIDPGFSVQKQQAKMLGLRQENFDVYNYRGPKLRDKLKSHLESGRIASIIYSNPNNPSWICFTEEELRIIGELATEYDAVVIEDLAYFAMDFRKDLSKPGEPPFQASVGRYTDNYILLISSSKSFSYAGQRIAMLAISDKLFNGEYAALTDFFPVNRLGHSVVYGAIYGISAGINHSSQYGLAAILKQANDGHYDFIEVVKHYGEIAKKVKPIFLANGFNIVYDMDEGSPIADGFYFTVAHPAYSGEQLVEKLIHYGISAIPLSITGSTREGIRACMSLISEEEIPLMSERLGIFKRNHS